MVSAYVSGNSEDKREITYFETCEYDNIGLHNLTTLILKEFGIQFQAANHFRLKLHPVNGDPRILHNSKGPTVQGVESGDTIELLHCGPIAQVCTKTSDSNVWDIPNVKKMNRDDFEVEPRPFGTGNFARIYRAKSKHGLGDVAWKVPYGISLEKQTVVESMIRELRIMASCDHPAVMKLIGVALPEGGKTKPAIVIPLLTGSLQDWIEKKGELGSKSLTNVEKFIVIYGIARGMQYLHRHMIQHRDLNPKNVLLTQDMEPVIIDFGASKVTETGETVIHSNVIGTALYMAPEAFGKRYSTRTDVYSYAWTVWAFWTRSLPYNREIISVTEIESRAIKNVRPGLPTETDSMTQFVADMIRNCWDPDSHKRLSFDQIVEKFDSATASVLTEKRDLEKFEEYQNKLAEKRLVNVSESDISISELESFAQSGESTALIELGRRYQTGTMVEPDLKRAVRYYREAAARGNPDGYFCLGQCYQHGIGLQPDPLVGSALIEKARQEESHMALEWDDKSHMLVPKANA